MEGHSPSVIDQLPYGTSEGCSLGKATIRLPHAAIQDQYRIFGDYPGGKIADVGQRHTM
jgi:hypothetical protein